MLVPVPESATVCVPSEASLATESVALKFVAALGVNEMLNVTLCPAEIEIGSDGELIAKYLVENEALLTLTVLFPELLAVKVRVLVVFVVTSPKSSVALPKTRLPLSCPPPEPDWLNPIQPVKVARIERTRTALAAFPTFGVAAFTACFFRITFQRVPLLLHASDAGGIVHSSCSQ